MGSWQNKVAATGHHGHSSCFPQDVEGSASLERRGEEWRGICRPARPLGPSPSTAVLGAAAAPWPPPPAKQKLIWGDVGRGEGMRAPVKAEQVLRDSGPHRKPQAKDPVLRGDLINPGKSVGRTHSWTPRRLADGGGGCERGEGDGFWGIGLSICKGNSGRSPVKISIPPHQ